MAQDSVYALLPRRRALTAALGAGGLMATLAAAPAHGLSLRDTQHIRDPRLAPPGPDGAMAWDDLRADGALMGLDPLLRFPETARARAGQRVKILGYILPLATADTAADGAASFALLSALPFHCGVCYSGRPGSLAGAVFGAPQTNLPQDPYATALVEGRLELLDDPNSPLLYRFADARIVG